MSDDASERKPSPFDGLDRAHSGMREVEEGIKDTAKQTYSRYRQYAEKVGSGVSSVARRGAEAVDGKLGDRPWSLVGLDERRTRIARKVVTDLVPRTVGERTTSFVDGVALKAGIGSAGLLLRLPLKPVAIPILGVLGVVEAYKVVRVVRTGIGGIAEEVDRERAAEGVETQSTV